MQFQKENTTDIWYQCWRPNCILLKKGEVATVAKEQRIGGWKQQIGPKRIRIQTEEKQHSAEQRPVQQTHPSKKLHPKHAIHTCRHQERINQEEVLESVTTKLPWRITRFKVVDRRRFRAALQRQVWNAGFTSDLPPLERLPQQQQCKKQRKEVSSDFFLPRKPDPYELQHVQSVLTKPPNPRTFAPTTTALQPDYFPPWTIPYFAAIKLSQLQYLDLPTLVNPQDLKVENCLPGTGAKGQIVLNL